MGITYDVVHRTEYRYGAPVSLSQQLLHLAPRDMPRQACLAHALVVDPAPSRRVDGEDAFGNPLTRLDFDRPHETLAITARLRVHVEADDPLDPVDSPAWEDVVGALAYRGGEALDEAHLEAMRYRVESPYVRIKTVFADYARPCFTRGRPLLEAAQALMQAIHADFTYSPEATQIATPLLDVFEKRHGVCQDFAHVMLACLRSLGLAARYVSGYLRTTPVEGKPRLVGADASHAWVSVFCPRQGWVDFDPTNRVVPSLQHVTLAAGRDFGDVSPLRGVILGGGAHELEVAVMVTPVEPAAA
ncbi:transglutaminase family protein [Dokdonella sp. MW10]|uniref:transglutaminase family protein n=1 Tax=Dokdonella sp. MW10 TaxID=2992926 RepID=UPI003F80C63E